MITDKTMRYGLREEILERIAREIGEAWRELDGETKLIIGNGAGSFAHYSAHEYKTAEGFVNEKSRIGMGWVKYDAVKLNQIVFEQLLTSNVPVFSYSPSSLMQVKNGRVETMFMNSVEDGIQNGIVPLVYGDPVVDQEKGCGIFSTEKVFDELAKYFMKNYEVKVIHVSAEEGVYKKGKASVFEIINRNNFEEVRGHLGHSNGKDVTGGMLHKVEECLELAKIGIESQIVSGMIDGRVRDVIAGKKVKGTKIC